MPKKFATYWYLDNPEVAAAGLFNCRDRDLRAGLGIPVGAIVQGEVGFAVAHKDVTGLTGNIISTFRPGRQCEWQKFILPCMVDPRVPAGKSSKAELRDHGCIVAELTSPEAVERARELKLSFAAHASGKNLINLSITAFEKLNKNAKATLL